MEQLKNKEVTIIVAYLAKTLGMRFEETLNWSKILAHMERISELTTNHSIIIDGKTWELLGKQFLPGRQYVVVSTTLVAKDLNRKAFLATNLTDAIRLTKKDKIFIIGEASLLKEALEAEIVNTIQVTIIHADLPFKDSFPKISNTWKSTYQGIQGIDTESNVSIQLITLSNTLNPFPPLVA